MKRKTLFEDFDNQYIVDEETGCWEWQRYRHKGYGRLRVPGQGTQRAHRVAYEKYVGPIPSKAKLRHTCDNPGCVNPTHLIPGTQKDNVEDMVRRGRDTHSLSNSQVHEARRRYASGEMQKDIAKSFGVSPPTISAACRGDTRSHIPFLPGEEYSLRKGNAKLSDEDVISARRRYADGELQKSIASSLGVSISCISSVCAGKLYRDVGAA